MNTTEKYFTVLGWWFDGKLWVSPDNKTSFRNLPNITQNFPDFKNWVLEKMEGEGFGLEISTDHPDTLFWSSKNIPFWDDKSSVSTQIIDNEILEAAVIAATRFMESKNGSKE